MIAADLLLSCSLRTDVVGHVASLAVDRSHCAEEESVLGTAKSVQNQENFRGHISSHTGDSTSDASSGRPVKALDATKTEAGASSFRTMEPDSQGLAASLFNLHEGSDLTCS